MQTLPKRLCLLHEARDIRIVDDNMRTRNRLLLIQAPDVQFVHAQHPGYRLEVVLDILDLDAQRRRLEEDLAAALRQGHRGDQDHDGDPHTNRWIGVEATGRLDEPDDDCGNDDADVVDCVADDVDQDAHDTQIHAVFLRRRHDVHVCGVRRGRRAVLDIDDAAVSVVVVVFVQEEHADDVEPETDAADD